MFGAKQVKLSIEPKSHLPVHIQLKEQIRFLILNGEMAPGTKLPTARQLAGFLRINRNTVLKSYQELVQEGLIECRQGKGCIVTERPMALTQPLTTRLLTIVDTAISQASEIGVNPDDFATFAYALGKQRRDISVKRRLVFVECEAPITTTLAKAIQERLNDVEVSPIILRDLREPSLEVKEQLREAYLVITTFFHIQEIKQLLSKSKKEVVALVVKPHLDKLVQIAEIPKGTRTALVCVSESCAMDMKRSLEHAGIKDLNTSIAGVDNQHRLAEAMAGRPVIIASDFVADKVRPLVQPDQNLIVLDFTALDEGAISLLRSMVTEELPA